MTTPLSPSHTSSGMGGVHVAWQSGRPIEARWWQSAARARTNLHKGVPHEHNVKFTVMRSYLRGRAGSAMDSGQSLNPALIHARVSPVLNVAQSLVSQLGRNSLPWLPSAPCCAPCAPCSVYQSAYKACWLCCHAISDGIVDSFRHAGLMVPVLALLVLAGGHCPGQFSLQTSPVPPNRILRQNCAVKTVINTQCCLCGAS